MRGFPVLIQPSARQLKAVGLQERTLVAENLKWTESEYVAHLNRERHLYAWCLVRFGSFDPAVAHREAELWYPYEPPSDPYRWLVFHDMAWHWAMLKIHGANYWLEDPTLEEPSAQYWAELSRIDPDQC
jgi:hypothetical protein